MVDDLEHTSLCGPTTAKNSLFSRHETDLPKWKKPLFYGFMQETARLFFLLFEKKKKENSHLTLGKREKKKEKEKEKKEKKGPNSHFIPL